MRVYGVCDCGLCTSIERLNHPFEVPRCKKCKKEVIRKGDFDLRATDSIEEDLKNDTL